MGLKGTTIIELTDVNNGEVESIVEENMITKALSDFFSHNVDGMLFNVSGSAGDLSGNMTPICPNGIGGVLLFSDAIVEDENVYYAPSANPCIGYASNDVNATANVMRGSLNLTETQKLENGYKFVWDFTTSQGNGTISAVALTHKWAGIGYMGDLYNNTSKHWHMKALAYSNTAIVRTAYVNVVEIDFDGNCFYTIGLNTSNELIIQKIRKSFRSIGLNDTMLENEVQIIDEHTLTPTVFIMDNPSNNSGNYDFMDGKDGFWYGFWHDSNSSGNAIIKWIKIKKSDYSFSEGTWTIENAQLYQMGYHYGYNTAPQRTVYCALRDGYLYVMAYNRQSVYKININNVADVTQIKLGFTSNFSGPGEYRQYGQIQMAVIGDWIVCSDFRISTDDIVHKTTNAMPFSYTCTPVFQYGPFFITFGNYYGNSTRKNLFLLTPYLASINNMSTSVIKTADKTMKITYTITETE